MENRRYENDFCRASLTPRFGREIGWANLASMRDFHIASPEGEIFQTVSEKSAAHRDQALLNAV
ncbi:hypothetical protein [Paraburkholderia sp. JPY465]|uniref:hypothetical protein n=1 Tax=Paraburkholderia sp. JPY465 TaxID=3042285 RepID=UPI003D25CE52